MGILYRWVLYRSVAGPLSPMHNVVHRQAVLCPALEAVFRDAFCPLPSRGPGCLQRMDQWPSKFLLTAWLPGCLVAFQGSQNPETHQARRGF